MKSFAIDAERNNVSAYAVFSGTNTGPGGPGAPTGKTGGEIAKAIGISLPSVQNIKKELGLVKKRR